MKQKSLTRFVWLSIFAAFVTIVLKFSAYFVTGSVGLLSDALESIVNLAAAVVALFMLKLSEKPPDDDHEYGHTKAEYFSSVAEGVLILIASASIFITSIHRILEPKPIEQASVGLIISVIASIVNFTVAVTLLRVGKKNNSITLEADGHHLMTDVITSVGIILGVALVSLTNIYILDPIIAIFVAINIVFTGFKLIRKSTLGLMDTALPPDEIIVVKQILDKYCKDGTSYHGLRSRQSGMRRFISVHVLVPGNWSVQKGHDLLEAIELDICKALPKITVFTHLEPIEDPKSNDDIYIDRIK